MTFPMKYNLCVWPLKNREWVGYALAAFLMAADGVMLWARWKRIGERCGEMVVDTSTDKTTMESIVEAQHSLKNLQELVKKANITILKLWSVMVSRAPKVLATACTSFSLLHSSDIIWSRLFE